MTPDQLPAAYAAAIYDKNSDAFAALYAPEVRVFDLWAWIYDGVEAWRSMGVEWFESLGDERVVVEADEVRIERSTDMAFASAYVTYRAVDGERTLRQMTNRMTWVLQLIDGEWLVVHEHSSAPADGETLKVQLHRG